MAVVSIDQVEGLLPVRQEADVEELKVLKRKVPASGVPSSTLRSTSASTVAGMFDPVLMLVTLLVPAPENVPSQTICTKPPNGLSGELDEVAELPVPA